MRYDEIELWIGLTGGVDLGEGQVSVERDGDLLGAVPVAELDGWDGAVGRLTLAEPSVCVGYEHEYEIAVTDGAGASGPPASVRGVLVGVEAEADVNPLTLGVLPLTGPTVLCSGLGPGDPDDVWSVRVAPTGYWTLWIGHDGQGDVDLQLQDEGSALLAEATDEVVPDGFGFEMETETYRLRVSGEGEATTSPTPYAVLLAP